MRKGSLFLVPLIIIVLLPSCSAGNKQHSGCTPPPAAFSESDLVGTWVTTHLDLRSDTLIIKANGTYKQIIYLKAYAIDYETDWLPWRLEFNEDGIPFLHMTGMRMCAYAPDLFSCDQEGGSNEDWKSVNAGYWYDYCHDKMMLMPGEGILLVLGTKNQDQNSIGIELDLLVLNPLDTWIYRLETP